MAPLQLRTATLCLIAFSAFSANAEAQCLPLVYQDDFEKGADGWHPTDETAWKVKETDKGRVYSQFKKRSDYKPTYRSPLNISLLNEFYVGDFQLDVRVLSTHPDYGHRDVCLFFGYQNPEQFYYVHLGKKTDDHANQIFIVNHEPRAKISLETTPGTDWDDQWHDVRIIRRVNDGTIQVYFDDMNKPIMIATDTTFVWGRIGLGSFDDTGDWDDLVLRGTRIEKNVTARRNGGIPASRLRIWITRIRRYR